MNSRSTDSARPSAVLAEKEPGEAFKVLTQRVLFHHITSFMDGWPHFVLEFERAMLDKFPSRALWSAPGCVLHVAVSEGNERVLQALCELAMLPKYRNLPKLQLDGVSKCFACKKNTRMLALLNAWSAKSEVSAAEPSTL